MISKLPIVAIPKTNREVVRAPNEANNLHCMPAEILNDVFSNLWSQYSVIWTKSAGMHIILWFLDAILKHSVARGLPKWLLACKMFLYEGRAMLSRMASMTVGPWASDPNLTWNYSSLMVIMPSLQKKLTIFTGILSAAPKKIGALFRLNHVGLHTIEQAINYLKLERTVTGGVLRCLRVQTAFVNVCSECQRQAMLLLGVDAKASWKMDLECLLRAGLNLDRFELEVQDVNTTIGPDRLWHATNHWHEVVPHIEKEVRRVGRAVTRDKSGALSMDTETKSNSVLFWYERHIIPDTAAIMRIQPRRATKTTADRRITMQLKEEQKAFPEEAAAIIPEVEEAAVPISRQRKAKRGKTAANRDFAIFEDEQVAAKSVGYRNATNGRASEGTSQPKLGNSRPRVSLGELSNYSERDNRRSLR